MPLTKFSNCCGFEKGGAISSLILCKLQPPLAMTALVQPNLISGNEASRVSTLQDIGEEFNMSS